MEHWYLRREYTQALSFAQQVKSIRPRDAQVRNLIGSLYLKFGQLEKAWEEYNRAVEYGPDRSEFRENLEAAQNLLKR